jgi:uncharacterized membrane protein YbjE (DUF340 family)
MILLLSAVIAGIISGLYFNIAIPENLITVLLMFLVFSVGVDIGSEEKILSKLKVNMKNILFQSILTMLGSLVFGGMAIFFTNLNLQESLGASAGFGWYSLSGVMISNLYSPVLGAISFTANVIREVLAIILIPLVAKWSPLGAASIGGATSMDTMLGVISKSTDKETTLIAFGQGIIISLSVPLVITLIF